MFDQTCQTTLDNNYMYYNIVVFTIFGFILYHLLFDFTKRIERIERQFRKFQRTIDTTWLESKLCCVRYEWVIRPIGYQNSWSGKGKADTIAAESWQKSYTCTLYSPMKMLSASRLGEIRTERVWQIGRYYANGIVLGADNGVAPRVRFNNQ